MGRHHAPVGGSVLGPFVDPVPSVCGDGDPGQAPRRHDGSPTGI